MSEPGYKDEETLWELYHEQGLEQAEIGEKFGVSGSTIGDWMEKLGVPAVKNPESHNASRDELMAELKRLQSELEESPSQKDMNEHGEYEVHTYRREFESWSAAKEIAGVGTYHPNTDKMDVSYRDEAELRRLYHDEGLSQYEIAERFGCDRKTIGNWMDRHEIDINPGEKIRKAKLGTTRNRETRECDYCDADITRVQSNFRSEYAFCDDECRIAYQKQSENALGSGDNKHRPSYLAWGLRLLASKLEKPPTASDIDEHTPHGHPTYIAHFGSIQGAREAAGLQKHLPFGKKGLRKKSGVRHSYGPSWRKQRKEALKRDGYECVDCGMENEEHVEKYGRGLHVHHVHAATEFKDLEKADELTNLVALCASCHHRWEGIPVRPSN